MTIKHERMPMRISVLINVCTSFVLATGFAGQVLAASLGGGYSIGALTFPCTASGQGSGSLTESSPDCSFYYMTGSFLVSGSGQATYDTLHATANVGFSEVLPGVAIGSSLGSARGSATYRDKLTIDIPGRTGEIVDLVFTTEMNGTATAASDSSTYAQAQATLNVNINGYSVHVGRVARTQGDLTTENDYNPGLVQIKLGTPFSVIADLDVRALVQPLTAIDGKYTGDAHANFGSSAGITSFELFETGSDSLITDWDLTSESGEFGYYNPVPVPASVWLFGSGILGLIGVARRKKA
jgi:hypothetical protein